MMITEYPVKKVTLASGETLAYREAGSQGKTLLLIHGNMSSSLHYDVLMDALHKEYRIYAVDLRGFGDSSYHTPIDSLQDFAHDVGAFLEMLDLTVDCAIGWSTGGGVALELAAALPKRVKQVVLIESVGVVGYPMYKKDAQGQPILTERITTREEVAADPVQVMPIVHAYATGNKDLLRAVWNALIYSRVQPEPERYDRYLEAMLKQRNIVDVNFALITFNMTSDHNGACHGTNRLELIECPVLVIQGEEDMVVPRQYGVQTAELLGSRATLALLKNTGHSPLTDDLPTLVGLIKDFVE